ncbi:helicase associated domain-containing protein [Streptomyces collinus]
MLEHILGIQPPGDDEKPTPRRSPSHKWALNYEAARQFFEREGHLRVPRKHIERIVVDGDQDGDSHDENDGCGSEGAENITCG